MAGDWTGQIRVFNVADSKRSGTLTSNPPAIQEKLDAAEKAVAEAKSKLEALVQAQAAAETQLNTARTAAEVARKGELAALQEKSRQASAELEAIKTELEKMPESDRAAAAGKLAEAQKKVETAAAGVVALDKAPLNFDPKALDAALAQAQTARPQGEALAAAAGAELLRWQRAQAFMAVHRARQTTADLKSRVDGFTATAQSAMAPAEQAQGELAAVEKTAAASAASLKAKETEQQNAAADLAAARKLVADTETTAREKGEKKENAQLAATNAGSEAERVTAALAAKQKELTALEEEAAKLPAGSPERGGADAKANGPRGELARLQTALEAAQATLAAAKTVSAAADAEAAAAGVAQAKPREASQAAEARLVETTKAAETARGISLADATKLAELQKRIPGILAEAQAAKAKAEQEATAAAKELETARANADKIRSDYEARFHVASQPIAKS